MGLYDKLFKNVNGGVDLAFVLLVVICECGVPLCLCHHGSLDFYYNF